MVLWDGVEMFVPPMTYGGIFAPVQAPRHLLDAGELGRASLDDLPAASQLPASFVPHVVWRGLYVSYREDHYLAALGYGPFEGGTPWTREGLRLLWEASSHRLRLDCFRWAQTQRARRAIIDLGGGIG